jgi:hypothetical protein
VHLYGNKVVGKTFRHHTLMLDYPLLAFPTFHPECPGGKLVLFGSSLVTELIHVVTAILDTGKASEWWHTGNDLPPK